MSPLLLFWIRRILGLLAVLFALSVLVFALFNVVPGGDPALRMAGRHPTAETLHQIRVMWGFDRPIWVQYGDMMQSLLIKGDLISYQDQTNVLSNIARALPKTASIAAGAAVLWLVFGIGFGVLSGLRPGRLQDRVLTVLAMAGISTPIFWLGGVLLYLLTYRWRSSVLFSWIPPGGYVPLTQDPLGWASHLVLPWVCMSVVNVGFYSRVVRSSLLSASNADYVRTARAMGLSRTRVLLRHTLRTSLLPLVSLFSLDVAATIGGTVMLIEPVFGINGLGEYAQQSVARLDLPPLIALTLYGGFLIVLVATVADLVLKRLDPRIRLD